MFFFNTNIFICVRVVGTIWTAEGETDMGVAKVIGQM